VERIAGLILAAILRHEEAQTVAEDAARAKFESGEMALFERDPVAWKKAHGKYQSGPPVFYFRCSRAKVADLVQSAGLKRDGKVRAALALLVEREQIAVDKGVGYPDTVRVVVDAERTLAEVKRTCKRLAVAFEEAQDWSEHADGGARLEVGPHYPNPEDWGTRGLDPSRVDIVLTLTFNGITPDKVHALARVIVDAARAVVDKERK